jgi:hypothetical protein
MNLDEYLCVDTVSYVKTFVDLINIDRKHRQRLPPKIMACVYEMKKLNLFYHGYEEARHPYKIHFYGEDGCMALLFPYFQHPFDGHCSIAQVTYVFKSMEQRKKYRQKMQTTVKERNVGYVSRWYFKTYMSRVMKIKLYLLTRKSFVKQ